jgi:hypothetical protein
VKHLGNIFILLITLINFSGGSVQNVSNNVNNKIQITKLKQKFYHVSVDSFLEDTTPNEDFDLEEDTDEIDDNFLETMFSRNHLIISKPFRNHSFFYSFSHQSVKKFILYCSLKLYC